MALSECHKRRTSTWPPNSVCCVFLGYYDHINGSVIFRMYEISRSELTNCQSTMHAGYNVGWKTLFYLPAVTPHQHGPRLPTSGPAPNLPPFSFLGSSRMIHARQRRPLAAFAACFFPLILLSTVSVCSMLWPYLYREEPR